MKVLGFAALCAAGLSACSSGGGTLPGGAPAGTSTQSAALSAGPLEMRRLATALDLPLLIAPPSRGSRDWLTGDAKTGRNVVYSGDFVNSKVEIYPLKGQNPAPIGEITTGISSPERMFVDSKRNLYVTNDGHLSCYRPGKTSPWQEIAAGINRATGVVVGPDGTIYVANAGTNAVTVYPPGQQTPSEALNVGADPQNVALDAAGDVYVTYIDGASGSGVVEFPSGSTTPTNLGLNIQDPGGIEIDSSNNVVVFDSASQDLDIFKPGQTQPSKQIHYADGEPFELAFGKGQHKLYASIYPGGSTGFLIETLDYPNGTAPVKQINTAPYQNFESWPLAVSPDGAV